jgi:aspartyl protease
MKPNRTIATVAVLTLFFTPYGTVRGKKRGTNPERYETSSALQTIPLKIYRDFLPVAEAEIGGISGTQHFILDTGASPSVVSVDIARRLQLATTPSSFTAAGTVVPMKLAVLPEIDLGPIRATSLTVQVQDLSPLERDWGVPIAGIIGMDVLSKSSFRLDYDRSEIVFGESSHEGVPAPFDSRAGIAMLRVTLQGKAARLLVDTGSERVVLFGGNFAEGGWKGLRNAEETGTTVADRKIAMRRFSAPDILVGEQHFHTQAAYFVPATADPVFDGLLGVRALGFCRLAYDDASKTVYLQN